MPLRFWKELRELLLWPHRDGNRLLTEVSRWRDVDRHTLLKITSISIVPSDEVSSDDMSETPRKQALLDHTDIYYVYLIACHGPLETYVKIGMTCNLKRRISEVQTGCPFQIAHAFAIPSEYWEEARGLEKLLHMLLGEQRLRGEWYVGTETFFSVLDAVLRRINLGGFSYDELLEMPDVVGPEFEIMLHRHKFIFYGLRLPLVRGANPMDSAEAMPPERIASVLSGGHVQQYNGFRLTSSA